MLEFFKDSRKNNNASARLTDLSQKDQNDAIHSLRNSKPIERPRFEKFYIYGLLSFLGLLTADVTIIGFRDKMMPTSAPSAKHAPPLASSMQYENYDNIVARNIFNSDGVIPPALNKSGAKSEDDSAPVPSQLPMQLIGTIVHVNKARSIATVELKNINKILPFIPNDDMEGLATLIRIDRKRIVFRNNNNGRMEYIQIKDENAISFDRGKKTNTSGIDQRGNSFTVQRSMIDKMLNNLPELLQQARAVPYIPPGSSKVEGFIILDIAKDSIFENIGLKKNDVLKTVNNQKIDSPAKALELYNELKTQNGIALEVERDGRSETLNYTIQ